MPDYQVVVYNVPGSGTLSIGQVTAPNHQEARLAALSKYGEDCLRPEVYSEELPKKAIYENDDFDVRQQ